MLIGAFSFAQRGYRSVHLLVGAGSTDGVAVA